MSLYIPDTQADPGAIEAAAHNFREIAGRITGTGEGVVAKVADSAQEFSDLVAPQIRNHGSALMRAIEDAFRATFYAAATTRAWAIDVQDYKRERARLMQQWDKLHSHPITPETQDKDAHRREKLLLQRQEVALQLDGTHLHRWFQGQAASRGHQLADGPTSEHLRELAIDGSLGWGGYNLWPKVAPPPIVTTNGILVTFGEISRYQGASTTELLKLLLSGKGTKADQVSAMQWLLAFTSWSNSMMRSGHVLDSDEKDVLMFYLGALANGGVNLADKSVQSKLDQTLRKLATTNDLKIGAVLKDKKLVEEFNKHLHKHESSFGEEIE
jgi:hypothetical protein